MNLRQALADLEQRRDQILSQLCFQIEALPDNPRIKRISEQSFVLRASDLGNTWAPEHYDFKRCYKLIVAYLRKQPASQFAVCFKRVIDNKQLIINPSWKIRLHADVVAHLERIYRGESCQLRLTDQSAAVNAEPSSSPTKA